MTEVLARARFPQLAQRLLAPGPGWSEEADVIIVGSGIAGLSLALHLRSLGLRVLVVTKGLVDEGSTRWAQGGIAAALSDEDTAEEHYHDTMIAGAGLCDEAAVNALAHSGAAAVRRLVELGARFDRTDAGELLLTREGGHLRDRIAHAGGDATGAEISRALVQAVRGDPRITLYEQALALDLLLDDRHAVQGLTLHVMGQGQRDGVGAALAPAVVLATGGLGQVFSATTNPAVATGDGVAMALRAGAEIADLEFVQFHPTVLWLGQGAKGQQPLISEAVRGEGACLVDDSGHRYMQGVHELADLAPRDVVAKATMRRMMEQGSEHVWLDGRELGADVWRRRFPTIMANCRALGIDPVTERIPVAPAQHYASGGVRTDLSGRCSVRGLYACGEVACSGVHGANRLASNSLLEGLVFAERIGADLARDRPPRRPVQRPPGGETTLGPDARSWVQDLMSADAGVLRSAGSLATAERTLQQIADDSVGDPRTETWETTNILTVAAVLARQAYLRTETRGSHWREDHPHRLDPLWQCHLGTRLRGAEMVTRRYPLEPPTWQAWSS